MAIFSRRDVQAAVDRLSGRLTAQQLSELVGRLNGKPVASLAAIWETVILEAFSNCGYVAHANDFGGKTRPDIFFRLNGPGSFEFVADITAISDGQARAENPYEDFCEEIRIFMQKLGHSSAGLNIGVGHTKQGKYGNQKVRLTLPPKGELHQFVKVQLGSFLKRIASNPETDDKFIYGTGGISFSLQYNAKEKRGSSGGHICFTTPYSIQHNPLAHALEKKRSQLSRCGYSGPRGIIVCDNGCDALKEINSVSGMVGCQEIVEHFQQSHPSVLWVLVLRIMQRHSILHSGTTFIDATLYWNQQREKSLFQNTLKTHDRMLALLPQPETAPINAVRRLNGRNKNQGRPMGKTFMQDKTIKISARSLTDLLAEKVTLQQFLENHNFKPHSLAPKEDTSFQFFAHQVNNGHTLKKASVEKHEHIDDDWIVLEYDGPDPAISPYRTPKPKPL